MAENRDPLIRLQLEFSPEQPGLLEGLDTWLRLGLMTDMQVRRLCQQHLSCDLPPVLTPIPAKDPPLSAVSSPLTPITTASTAVTPPSSDDILADIPTPRPSPRWPPTGQRRSPRRPSPPTASRPVSPVSHWLDRLVSELSIVWLLGLGVFLVVLSSAVLAATQWARFNAAGQYLVLLSYTLVFWAAGGWCRRNPHLQLTAKTLQIVTLLLVPLNFWAMDGLGVWQGASGLLVGTIAAVLLTLVTLRSLQHQEGSSLDLINLLALAYGHTGWGLGWMPLIAIYGGALGSAAIALYSQSRPSQARPSQARPSQAPQGNAPVPTVPWPKVALGAALGLLLLRALTVTVPQQWGQFALAFGLYGATGVWLGQRRLSLAAPLTGSAPSETVPPAHLIDRWSIGVGRGLMLWGWVMAIADWLTQAFGVSALGLGLRLQALRKFEKRLDLLMAYGIAVQLAFVGWEILPLSLRQWVMAPLSVWAGRDEALLGISLFPYVIGMVALADRYFRRGNANLGRFSEGIAFGSGLLLTLISSTRDPILVVNLIASTIAAFVATLRRDTASQRRILLCYGLTVLTLIVAIAERWPELPLGSWVGVMFALAALFLLLSNGLPALWGRGAEFYGIGLSALAYTLLWGHLVEQTWQSGLSWLGLVVPVVLAGTGRYRASVALTGLAVLFTLGQPWTRLVGLGTAVVLTSGNSLHYRHRVVPWLAIAFGLGFVVSGLEDGVPNYPAHAADWGWVTLGLIAVLWIAWRVLSTRTGAAVAAPDVPLPLASLYRGACDLWGHTLVWGLLAFMTVEAIVFYLDGNSPQILTQTLLGFFLLTLGLRYWGRVSPEMIYLGGWGLALLLVAILVGRDGTVLTLAPLILGLGAIALLLSAFLERSHPALAPPLQVLTLTYGGLALLLRADTATAWTGWLVVGAALLLLEIGRRNQVPSLRWLALFGLSVGWYELVIYQMLQSSGGFPADGLIILAGVAALIMGVYRLAAGQLERTIQLPQTDLIWAAHLHWGVGSVLMLGAGMLMAFDEATLAGFGLAIAISFGIYALSQGRLGQGGNLKGFWVYVGLVELVGWVALLRLTFPALQRLDSGWGMVACAVAVPVYWVPWSDWGWPQRPWRVMAIGVPLGITILTGGYDHIPSLWVLAGFYGWLAWHSRQIRVSYLSAGCAVLAIWVWLNNQGIQDEFAITLPLGLALLYGAQVDPFLKEPGVKKERHWLRIIVLGMVLLAAYISDHWTGIPVGIMALGAIAAGIATRTRAFLYTGTAIFGLNALNQLVVLNATYPFIKWVVGILLGVALIWIAADFERRRDQWLILTQNWIQDLAEWQ